MILLFIGALLFLPSKTDFVNKLSPHSVDSLKLKCDALPFRTAYVENRCYFAVIGKVSFNDASTLCSTKFRGAKATQFHNDSSSTVPKNSICVFEGGYTCEQGYELIRRKCTFPAKKKMNYVETRKYCKKIGLELPSPENDLENQILAVGGSQSTGCKSPAASVVDKSGYWSNADQQNQMTVICAKDATNEYTQIPQKKEVIQVDGPCAVHHELNDETGKCEWTGPTGACAALLDHWNHTYFVTMKEGFPDFVHTDECLKTTGNFYFDEMTTRVVVRKGCMFTGYAHPMTGNGWQEVKLVEDLLYGIHNVPNYIQTLPVRTIHSWTDGLTRAECFCDPAEATVHDHVPAPPPDKKCVEYHAFNETTQQCEWTKEPKFCAEITTNDNRKLMLEIPKWPEKKRYDVNHWAAQYHLHFHIQWKTLLASGYGKHEVASPYNGMSIGNHGTSRFICQCIR